jgi:poly [ADP-ribose] polymerase 10/14/15
MTSHFAAAAAATAPSVAPDKNKLTSTSPSTSIESSDLPSPPTANIVSRKTDAVIPSASAASTKPGNTDVLRRQTVSEGRPPAAEAAGGTAGEQRKRFNRDGKDQGKMTFDGFTVNIGSICNQNVDVIVNSVGPDLEMKQGAISASLLAAAGSSIQDELNRVAPKFYCQPGDVFVTKGYKLHCKHVIHVIFYHFKGEAQEERTTVQGYRNLIKRIFAVADTLKAESIAIPPIGCGKRGYPPPIVATVMTEERISFVETHPDSPLKEFHFVVLATDTPLIQAFSKLAQADDSNVDVEVPIDIIKQQAEETNKAVQNMHMLGISVPSHWSTVESCKPYEKYELLEDTKEYQAVIQNMIDHDGARYVPFIYKIERVENREQYKMYECRKRLMAERNRPRTENERILWHGTDAVALESICQYGFNRAYCGKNAVLYGNGVYSARYFSYSASDTYSPPDSASLKRVIQCRVLTGDYTFGEEDMKAPPEKAPGILYDTAVDDVDNPELFVVFYDFQMYPEYIITFFSAEL